MSEIEIRISPPVTNEALNELFATAWDNYEPSDFEPILKALRAHGFFRLLEPESRSCLD